MAAALHNLRMPTIPITALGCHSRARFKGYGRSSGACSPDICVDEKLPHCCTGITMGDTCQGVVEVIEAALVCGVCADGKAPVLLEDAEVEGGEDSRVACDEGRSGCGRR